MSIKSGQVHYAAARNPDSISLAGVEAVKLDVTSDADVAALIKKTSDVNIVINNAGIASMGGFLAEGSIEASRNHFETNVIGMLRVSKAYAPILAKNGGGAFVNVLSVASFLNSPPLSTYAMSKSAAWALTNGLRNELAAQKTQVLGLHVGFMDTDMAKGIDSPKTHPDEVVKTTFDALVAGQSEVFADEVSRYVKNELSGAQAPYLTLLSEGVRAKVSV